MFEHIWSVLCERISIDRDTNLASYLTAVEGISTKQLPTSVQNLSLGTRWHKKDGSEAALRIRLSLISPEGIEKILVEGEQRTASRNHRVNFILNGLVVDKIGHYALRLQVKNGEKWSTVQEIPLEVSMDAPSIPLQVPDASPRVVGEKKPAYRR